MYRRIKRNSQYRKINCISLAEYQKKQTAGLLDTEAVYMVCDQSKVDEDEEIPAFCEVYDAGGNRVQ